MTTEPIPPTLRALITAPLPNTPTAVQQRQDETVRVLLEFLNGRS